MRIDTQSRFGLAAHLAFAAFGLFWGTWGAALPALRTSAALDEAALGTALLFVGLGALPAMLLTGRGVDRLGARLAGALLIALAVAGVATAVLAVDLPTLAAGMALVGATSGAADVAANTLAGLAERRSGRRVITLSHATFSAFVVVGALGTGALRAAGADVVAVFAVSAAFLVALGAAVLVLGDAPGPATSRRGGRRRDGLPPMLPFIMVGLVGALGFALENAHQSWSAIFLTDELGTTPALTAFAPATFAAVMAVTRFAAGVVTGVPPGVLLVGGACVALSGTVLLSLSTSVPLALAALALAAMGSSVLFPTLLSRATHDVAPDRRGRATSAVATTSYLGFVLGPWYVGVIAGVVGLRGALIGVALLAAAFAVLAPAVSARRPEPAATGPAGR